ncbi:dihydropteroate synthase [Paucibacter sp. PLA-PC-4]|uniref:dihydropteroate synthase n=1 Tax=Paucibacter sp. PLA-PC-4 TaxID=2993655 RepID=UPI00224A6BE3|nr:dihydropteroate synthase [Paucibacter sp. PLA-PC-4]MCX2865442.1 dihydropteroate synthase [Paucibacter sp. PLA-PC-4]
MLWQTTRYAIDLSRPRVMGIVNVTPDSFSDGGQHCQARSAIAHCERLVKEGADILDIGGESTRPGSQSLAALDEWARIEQVLRAALSLGVPVSVDSCKTEVMRRALDLGVDIVNDIQALQAPGALALLAAQARTGVCLMHMRGEPSTMQSLTDYQDLAGEVRAFLAARAQAASEAGMAQARICLDPGYGFAKTAEQNFELLREQVRLLDLGYPLLVGWSRKAALGKVTGRAVDERVPASVAAALVAVARGARVLRVHDVAATSDALKVWAAAQGPGLNDNSAH